jgi:biotin-(acetyl-CoA carboxylase) ligase
MNLGFNISRVIELDKTTSTQDIAKESVETFTEGCVLIQAKTQTNGRGRYERKWD